MASEESSKRLRPRSQHRSPPSSTHQRASRAWLPSIASATAETLRKPLNLTVLALCVVCGVFLTSWPFAVALAACAAMVTMGIASHRREVVLLIGSHVYSLNALALDEELARLIR